MGGGEPQFQGHNLACRRGERLVFAGLGFALESGGALLLTGPNGSGKSSLLRLMAGLLRPVAGALAWKGRPVAEAPEELRGSLHYVGHLDAVKPVLTLSENLSAWAALRGTGPERVPAALEALDLARLSDLPARLLSSGQRRRLALSRLLASPAPLWLLDEPTVGLDKASLGRLNALLAAHRAEGGMIVVSTHQPLDLPGAATLELEAFALEHRPGDPGSLGDEALLDWADAR